MKDYLSQGYDVILLSDPTGRSVCSAYNMLERGSLKALPGGVIVGRAGRILHSWCSSFTVGADMREVVRVLREMDGAKEGARATGLVASSAE
jgi:alkyl hydroperoxide reductase subunit AhpC